MCLETVDSVVDEKWKNPDKIHTGWKVVDKSKDFTQSYKRKLGKPGFKFPCYQTAAWRPFDQWLSAKVTPVTASDTRTYKSGFHIFTSRDAARKYRKHENGTGIVVRVKFRGINATGSHMVNGDIGETANCVIAREMKIPNPSRKKVLV